MSELSPSGQGRMVFVAAPRVAGGFTPFQAYLVAVDNDFEAIEAVRRHLRLEDFDEHRFEPQPHVLSQKSVLAVGLKAGEVMYWSEAPVRE